MPIPYYIWSGLLWNVHTYFVGHPQMRLDPLKWHVFFLDFNFTMHPHYFFPEIKLTEILYVIIVF